MKALLALLAVTSACSLYSGSGGGSDAMCAVAKTPIDVEMLIDPSTNQCDSFTIGGGGCACEPCPDQGAGSGQLIPGWAQCDSACTALAEQACLTTTGCHATYQTNDVGTTFWTCDAVAVAGAANGACATLGAQDCSTRDDCTATFLDSTMTQVPTTSFASCAAEVPAVACATITDEATCTARTDCEAVYTGTNCTCDEHGCTCATETFAYCETPGRL